MIHPTWQEIQVIFFIFVIFNFALGIVLSRIEYWIERIRIAHGHYIFKIKVIFLKRHSFDTNHSLVSS